MKKKTILFILIPFAVIVMAALIRNFIPKWSDNDTSPVYFPLNDPKAYYSINKTGSDYWVVHNKDMVFVGNSKVTLESFISKRIKINGNYSGRIGDQQCIVNKCHALKGAMIDIYSIQEVK
jgi:hypothetical protein